MPKPQHRFARPARKCCHRQAQLQRPSAGPAAAPRCSMPTCPGRTAQRSATLSAKSHRNLQQRTRVRALLLLQSDNAGHAMAARSPRLRRLRRSVQQRQEHGLHLCLRPRTLDPPILRLQRRSVHSEVVAANPSAACLDRSALHCPGTGIHHDLRLRRFVPQPPRRQQNLVQSAWGAWAPTRRLCGGRSTRHSRGKCPNH
mmetsp:Transcript_63851/g.160931  ORF Transcript_63851/g.160931 Transcript_63851/m.160931 type:complete len:200 (+) Transcript_63851:456-1055(+)